MLDCLDSHPYAQASLRDRRPFGRLSVRVAPLAVNRGGAMPTELRGIVSACQRVNN